ncbi:flagellar export chaperone FliS [Brevibacillus fluminis]|uniref:Flagellar export chaperone FliS n=1 Tax=Brevibacillus fluminis TaxID=511487 RepID=A0A3M8DWZ6_9BACL|nr:flagellar export chaperone FliS [Brevibacillus fluminis]RNB92648.1 flagellar export chaperone FliS [Brevibacillus fluminis]
MSNPITEESLYQLTSQELTLLLYEALQKNLVRASDAIHGGRLTDANLFLQRCNDILHRLGVGINYEAGIIADQLEHIYNYMAERIIEANLQKDVAIIEEVQHLLKQIADAWKEAVQKAQAQTQAAKTIKRRINAYDQDLYDMELSVDRKE